MKLRRSNWLFVVALVSFSVGQANSDEIHEFSSHPYADKKAVGALLSQGIDANAPDQYGQTPLHHAAMWGYDDIVDLLVKAGADVNLEDDAGERPIEKAALHGRYKIVRHLIEAGAERIPTILHTASAHPTGSKKLVKTLLDLKFDANAPDQYGQTPLHHAATSGYEEIATILLNAGAKVNAVSDSGDTPLKSAEIQGHEGMIGLLKDHGGVIE